VTVRVGGVSIGFGMDNTRLLQGLEVASSKVKDFQKTMTSIRLAAVIKGDPFSETRKYMSTARKELTGVFDEWKTKIGYVASSFNKFAEESRRSTQAVIKDWEMMSKRIASIQSLKKGALSEGFRATQGKATPIERSADMAQYITGLEKTYGNISPKVNQYLDKLKQNITGKFLKDGMDVQAKVVQGSLQHLEGLIRAEGEKVVKEAELFGQNLKAAFLKQGRLDFLSQGAEAKSPEAALARRRKALKDLTIAEHTYRTEIGLGIDVDRNRVAIYQNLNRRQELGAKLTKQQAEELKKYRKSVDDAKGASEKFLSPQWIKSRLRWFVQLRAAWAAWRGITEAIRGAMEFEQAMANVQAISQATTAQFDKLSAKALEIGSTTRFSAKEAAEGMTIFAQAGLNANEILAATMDTAHLATATLFDFKRTAEIVTSIMRAWGIAASDSKRIVDVLATSINVTKLTMDGLSTSLSYLTGVAPQLNIGLEETTALLGTLVDRGLTASIAATSLRAVMAELIKPTDRFRMVLAELGLNLKDVDPQYKAFSDILITLQDAGWGASESFKAFERRAAAGASIAVQNARQYKELASKMNDTNRALEMAERNLDTTSGQWKQFQDVVVSTISILKTDLDPMIKAIIKDLQDVVKILGIIARPITWSLGGLFSIDKLFNLGAEDIKLFSDMQLQLKEYKDSLIAIQNEYVKLREGFNEYKNEVLGSTKVEPRFADSTFNKAVEMAKTMGLISDKELETLHSKASIEDKINKNYKERMGLLEMEGRKVRGRAAWQEEYNVAWLGEKVFDKKIEQVTKAKSALDRVKVTKTDPIYRSLIAAQQERFDKEANDLQMTFDLLTADQKKVMHKQYPELLGLLPRPTQVIPPDFKGFVLEKEVGPASKQQAWWEESLDQKKDRLKLEVQLNKEELNTLKREEQVLDKAEDTTDIYEKRLSIINAINAKQDEIAGKERVIEEISNKAKKNEAVLEELAELKYKNVLLTSEQEGILSKIKVKEGRRDYLSKIETIKLEKDLLDINRQKIRQKISMVPPEEELKLELKELAKKEASKRKLITIEKIYTDKQAGIKALLNDIAQIEDSRIELAERLKRATDPIYDAYKRMEESAKNTNQFLSDLYVKAGTDTAGGLADIFTKATGGFQEAQQEVENLKGTLAGLIQERDKILEDGIITSDEVDRFKELQTEISQTSNEINDLEDPIQNLKESFKDFFKSAIDGIREVIAKWIAMKIVTGAMKLIVGGMPTDTFNIATEGSLVYGKGGLLPSNTKFDGIRSFARGGVTNNPTLALLGDNRSAKEIILPLENIKSDSVGPAYTNSGDSGGSVTIINVVTEDALAREMSKPKLGRVIINRVYENIDSGGILSRR